MKLRGYGLEHLRKLVTRLMLDCSMMLMIARKRGNSVKFTGERRDFTGEERRLGGEVQR